MIPTPCAFALRDEALAAVVASQNAAGRREICGLCAVDSHGIQHFLFLTNHSGEPDRFETSTTDEANVRSIASLRGWSICAFVHTHVSGKPEMSRFDRRCFDRDALPWVILVVTETRVQQHSYCPRIKFGECISDCTVGLTP